jgi:hypothetical protein
MRGSAALRQLSLGLPAISRWISPVSVGRHRDCRSGPLHASVRNRPDAIGSVISVTSITDRSSSRVHHVDALTDLRSGPMPMKPTTDVAVPVALLAGSEEFRLRDALRIAVLVQIGASRGDRHKSVIDA